MDIHIGGCLLYLGVSVESGMVQGSSPPAVWHIYTAQQWDDELSTTQSLIGSCHMKRRLPVLVTCIHVSRVTDQNTHCLLDRKEVGLNKELCTTYSRHTHGNLSFINSILHPHKDREAKIYSHIIKETSVQVSLSLLGTLKFSVLSCGLHTTRHVAGYETGKGRNWSCSNQC